MNMGFSPVAFTVMGKGRQEFECWSEMGKVPRDVRSPVLTNSGRSPEATTGWVTFELEPYTGFNF